MKKHLISLLSSLFPQAMANLAYRKLTNPQVTKLRPNELAVLAQAKQSSLKFGSFDIKTYEWGNPTNEVILLIHGWEGQAGNFADMVPKLWAKNYRVVAFDGPSHGFSSTGPTSVFEFSDLVAEMIEKYAPKKLVSHSFGGLATTYALYQHPELAVEKYLFLTTPDLFSERINHTAQEVGISDKVRDLLVARIENEMNVKVDSIGVSLFVKSINVGQAMIIHDKFDKVIPIARSRNVYENWPVCQLKEVEGTGHFGILRNGNILNMAIDFLGAK